MMMIESLIPKLKTIYLGLDKKLKEGKILKILEEEKGLEQDYAFVESCRDLADLSEETLWETFGAALMNNSTKIPFTNFK